MTLLEAAPNPSGGVMVHGSSASDSTVQTWIWQSGAWTQSNPATEPPARYGGMLAYDPATSTDVLFGGYESGVGDLADTWVWDGTDWTQESPAQSPPTREYGALAYDADLGGLVLYGGTSGNGSTTLSDTWLWDGTTWTQVNPSGDPGPREEAAMATDPAGGVLMYGGFTGEAIMNDTWQLTGSSADSLAWAKLAVSPAPSAGDQAEMAYDPVAQDDVLWSGQDTWTWTGQKWLPANYSSEPPGRIQAALAYDSTSSQVLLFGGWTFDNTYPTDTWLLTPQSNTTVETPTFTSPRAVVTNTATGGTARFTALVNCNGVGCTLWEIDYGTTTAYGQSLSGGFDGSTGTESLQATTPNLPPGVYHWRITATNRAGTTSGSDLTVNVPKPVKPTATLEVTPTGTTTRSKATLSWGGTAGTGSARHLTWRLYKETIVNGRSKGWSAFANRTAPGQLTVRLATATKTCFKAVDRATDTGLQSPQTKAQCVTRKRG